MGLIYLFNNWHITCFFICLFGFDRSFLEMWGLGYIYHVNWHPIFSNILHCLPWNIDLQVFVALVKCPWMFECITFKEHLQCIRRCCEGHPGVHAFILYKSGTDSSTGIHCHCKDEENLGTERLHCLNSQSCYEQSGDWNRAGPVIKTVHLTTVLRLLVSCVLQIIHIHN